MPHVDLEDLALYLVLKGKATDLKDAKEQIELEQIELERAIVLYNHVCNSKQEPTVEQLH